MKKGMLKGLFLTVFTLITIGCGGGSGGGSSSFDDSKNNPTIDNIIVNEQNGTSNEQSRTSNEQNISSIIKEVNGEYIIYVNENQRTAFTINSKNNNKVTYALSGGDWREFDIDRYRGEFFFKEHTDYEKKPIYNFQIVVDDGFGHVTEKKATIYVLDTKVENVIEVVQTNTPLPESQENNYFITTWKTDIEGSSNPKEITIPTIGDGYNYSVDWGDGSSSKNVTENITHVYDHKGTYTLKIVGDFPQIRAQYDSSFLPLVNNKKLLSVEQWGDIKWHSISKIFQEFPNAMPKFTDAPNLSHVTDLSDMFSLHSDYNDNTGTWELRRNLKNFNQDISNWDTSNIVNMSSMFSDAQAFNQDIGNWDVSNVTDMSNMFSGAKSFNQDIGNWDVSYVGDMSNMFSEAKAFNQDIGRWNVSNVMRMDSMFENAESFNQNIKNWNIKNVLSSNYFGLHSPLQDSYNPFSGDKNIEEKIQTYLTQNNKIYISHKVSKDKTRAVVHGDIYMTSATEIYILDISNLNDIKLLLTTDEFYRFTYLNSYTIKDNYIVILTNRSVDVYDYNTAEKTSSFSVPYLPDGYIYFKVENDYAIVQKTNGKPKEKDILYKINFETNVKEPLHMLGVDGGVRYQLSRDRSTIFVMDRNNKVIKELSAL